MNMRRTQQRLMAHGGVVDPYATLRAAWDAASPTLLYSAPREVGYINGSTYNATEQVSGVYNATNATPANRPTYLTDGIGGRPAFSFGGSHWLQAAGFTFAQPNTIVIICKLDSASLATYQFVTGVSSAEAVFANAGGSWSIFAGTSQSGGSLDTDSHIVVASFNGSSSYLEIDGVTVVSANPGANALSGITLGANPLASAGFLVGKLSEAAIFNTPPTSGKLDDILAAASTYYSIPIS